MLYRHVESHNIEPPTCVVGGSCSITNQRPEPRVGILQEALHRLMQRDQCCRRFQDGSSRIPGGQLRHCSLMHSQSEDENGSAVCKSCFRMSAAARPLNSRSRPTISFTRQGLTCAETELWFMSMVHLRKHRLNIPDGLPKRL